MSRSKGDRYERMLFGEFIDAGWWAKRIDASGSGTKTEQPDVMAACNGLVLLMELKFSAEDRIYLKQQKVDDLQWVADQFTHGQVYLVGRWKGDTTFYFFTREQAQMDEGGYRLHYGERESAIAFPAR